MENIEFLAYKDHGTELDGLKIFNGTEHEINIYNPADAMPSQSASRKLIVKDSAIPITTIPGGRNLNCTTANAELPNHLKNTALPLQGALQFVNHDPIPEDFDLVFVSSLYRSAVKELGGDTSRLVTVDSKGAVYINEAVLRPCGCTKLNVG